MCRDAGTKANDATSKDAPAFRKTKDYAKYCCHGRSDLEHIAKHCKAKAPARNGEEASDNEVGVCVATVLSVKHCTGFVVDSRASEHILNDSSGFASLEESDQITVHMDDNTKVVASKQGTVWLDFNSVSKQSKQKT